jgi:hypothetical protein
MLVPPLPRLYVADRRVGQLRVRGLVSGRGCLPAAVGVAGRDCRTSLMVVGAHLGQRCGAVRMIIPKVLQQTVAGAAGDSPHSLFRRSPTRPYDPRSYTGAANNVAAER